MAAYIIGYDLDKPDQNYPELIKAIKEFGTWWHDLDSTWVVVSNSSSKDIRDYLKTHIGQSDKLFVAKLSGEAAWTGFDDETSSWLKDNL